MIFLHVLCILSSPELKAPGEFVYYTIYILQIFMFAFFLITKENIEQS